MTEARIRTGLWVQAQILICDRAFLPAVVEHRGDPDAGTVLLRLLRRDRVSLLLRRSTFDNPGGWMIVGGSGLIEDAAADAYIAREIARDRDLWVLAIDDPAEGYVPDGPIES